MTCATTILTRTALLRYAWLYNHHLPQTALDARTPMQAMKDWYRRRSDLFQKRPHNHPGHDI